MEEISRGRSVTPAPHFSGKGRTERPNKSSATHPLKPPIAEIRSGCATVRARAERQINHRVRTAGRHDVNYDVNVPFWPQRRLFQCRKPCLRHDQGRSRIEPSL